MGSHVRRHGTQGRATVVRHVGAAGLGLLALAFLPEVGFTQSADSVGMRWTAPGDDGRVGTASSYEMRYSLAPITATNFASATLVPNLPAPAVAGTSQRVTVRGLTRGTTYWFAVRTVDDAGNWSGLSNVAMWDWNLDTAPPAAPAGLSAAREATDVRVQWSANAEVDLAGYTVYRAFSASGPFTALNASLVTATEYLDDTVPSDAGDVWYRVTASDATGNESAQSGTIHVGPAGSTEAVAVEPGFPNPSRRGDPVSVPVVIPGGSSDAAVLDVLDSGGRRVRRLDLKSLPPGRNTVVWDGRNDSGAEVVPGVYRAWLIAGGTRTSIVLLRVP